MINFTREAKINRLGYVQTKKITYLYKRAKDQDFRLCANEKEYLPLLKQAHA